MRYLVVNSDDFGMCHAVNRGIVRGFKEGILTQSTLMAPAPWFEEAVALAKEHDLPVGVHLTAACDWDRYQWRPVTNAPSMTKPDGTFFNSLQETAAKAKPEEWEAEFLAQVALVRECGIEPTHLDSHMTPVPEALMAKICRRTGIPTRRDLGQEHADCMYPIKQRISFSFQPMAERKAKFRAFLEGLDDGWHFFCCHLAEDSDELAAMCSADWHARRWTREVRVMDLELVLDPVWKDICKQRGIKLASFRELRKALANKGMPKR